MTAEAVEPITVDVWGDPISHSLSPRLHNAAYAELGWPWRYGSRRVAASDFSAELETLGPQYRGLSLTYPLKGAAFAAASRLDQAAELTGSVNTLVLRGAERIGFNTDVGGLVADLRDHGVVDLDRARIVGTGATATSALVALAHLGVTHVDVVARRPEAAAHLRALGERLAVSVSLSAPDDDPADVSLTLATLPGGAEFPTVAAARLAESGGLLYDVVYGHWPTVLGASWLAIDARAVNGLGMLLQQAVLQVRAFATGETTEPLPRESAVVAVMRAALMGD